MQSYYEINVSLNGHHLFATAERSAVNEAQHKNLLKVFKAKFPSREGFEINSTFWQVEGHRVGVNNS